jgi:hypothetical protein
MALTASKLRENIYKILDQILETGVPVEIERDGKLLRISTVEPQAGEPPAAKVPAWRSRGLGAPRLVQRVAAMIHLDTHVIAWLYAGRTDILAIAAR